MSKVSTKKKAYAQAGVDIALADKLLNKVKPALKRATRPESLGSIGGFGGFFDISKLIVADDTPGDCATGATRHR